MTLEIVSYRTIIGRVLRYSSDSHSKRKGKYRNVLLDGQTEFITIAGDMALVTDRDRRYGAGPRHFATHPKVGDKIAVFGIRKDGRFLTKKWEYIEK